MNQSQLEAIKKDEVSAQEDAELLLRIQQHDDNIALKKLFTKYFSKLCVFCYPLVNDKEAAKDIVQSMFMYIWEKRKELNIHTSVEGYLSSAVRKKSLTAIDQQKRWYSAENSLSETPTKILNPEQQLERESFQQFIAKKLPESIKEVYYLKHINGMKRKEIAKELNISELSVKKKLSKIKFYLTKLAAQFLLLILASIVK